MTPERWQQIEAIFNEALDLDEPARALFVKTQCGDDPDLFGEVERLLSQFEAASSFIERPLYDSERNGVIAALLDDGDDDPMIGKVLGRYRIEREIGRGGMGAVYEAVRADGEFRRRVAVKVVKRGIDTDFVLKRFRNERQILAALDHPFITRLVDGGTTDDGRPYFVMDLIDGLPLYRYCDKRHSTIAERLRLFCDICEAVSYAHEKLVIHRDLKPSNIIVSLDGSPRLLDFGIAKLLDPEMASDTLQPTATALRMMTVDYASPEQVRGEKVGYATDVYSLGVILFELLTGFRPYRVKSRSPHDVARAVCDEEPLLPSDALKGENGELSAVKVNSAATTLIEVAELRREPPEVIIEQLRGNLDNIIMKALRKPVDERFASVSAFRDDIERHLKGEAVSVPSYFAPGPGAAAPKPADGSKLVAVLPLTLMSPAGSENTDESYLTVGLADAIITRLTSVRKLTVRPTSSITRYTESEVNPFRAGIELGVDFVLDGRIRRFGDRLRISLQLLDVKTVTAIWAGQFDEDLTDVLELEDAISEQVASALIPQLTGEEKQKLAKRGTDIPRAYEAYLKGRFYWNQFTTQSFPKAIDAFREAIELDPGYALAYVGVADFYTWANIYGLIPGAEAVGLANAAALKALQLDNELGEAYASMALILINQFQYEKGEELFLKSIDLGPHYPLVHEWYAALLTGNGRVKEGLVEIRRAEELDPLSLRTKTMVLWNYYQAGDFDTALAKADEIIGLDENYPQGHLQRGYTLCELDRTNEAIDSIGRAMAMMPGSSMVKYMMTFALAAGGRQSEAKAMLADMQEAARHEYVKPMFLGLASVAAGEIDDAFRYFEIAVSENEPWLAWFGTDAKLGPIRDDPRYHALMRRMRKSVDQKDRASHPSTDPNRLSMPGGNDAQTIPASEMPTLAYRPGLLRRHAVKMSAAAVILIGLIAAYATGILTVSFGSNDLRGGRSTNLPRSIAILPFENTSGDAADEYISDGMAEFLLARISESPEIRVISRSAAFSYRATTVDPQTIGRELGADSVLKGKMEKTGDRYTVNIELIDVAEGKRLFVMNFVESADRIFALQAEMAKRVVESLQLSSNANTLAQKSYTDNNEVFELYLKGEYQRQKATPSGTSASIDLYENAIRLDPNYALAYQGLSLAYRSAPAYGFLLPQDAYPKAKDAAQKALAIDPALSAAYVSLASVKATYDWDFAGAEKEYMQAIRLGTNNAEAHYSYANFLVAMGRSDEALTEFKIAQQLDPLSLNIQTNIGWALYIAGRYDEATTQIKQVIARDQSFARAHMNLGEILQEQGKYDEAIAEMQKARALSQDPLAEMALGHAYAAAGRNADALKIATDLEGRVRQKQVSPFLPAVVYAGLNEKDKSFYWLERAYQEHSNWLSLIKVGRRLKNLHGDPRFDDLLNRVGFNG